MPSFCWNEREHRRQAERDFERGRKDRDMYERHSFDDCKRAYTEEYDRQRRAEEWRQIEQRDREEQERRRMHMEEQRQRQEWLDEEYRQAEEQRAIEEESEETEST